MERNPTHRYGHDFYYPAAINQEATEHAHRQQHQAAWMEEDAPMPMPMQGQVQGQGNGSRWAAFVEEEDEKGPGMMAAAASGGGDDDDEVGGLSGSHGLMIDAM